MPDPLIDESAPLAVKLIRDRSVLICLLVQASTKLATRDREILELQERVRELEAYQDLCAYSANPDDGCRFCGGMWPFSGPCPARLGKIAELESRILELTEWRPMETAPRDGSVIALMISDRTATVGEWCERTAVWDTQYGVFEGKDEHRPPEPGEAWPVGWLPLPEEGGR